MEMFMRRFVGLVSPRKQPHNDTTPVTSTSARGKKRQCVDLSNEDENEDPVPANKRQKVQSVNISEQHDEDTISVAHHNPLGELDGLQLANQGVVLNEQQFAERVEQKLYVNRYTAISSGKSATKTRKASAPKVSALKAKVVSISKVKPKLKSKAARVPGKVSGTPDLRKMMVPKAASPRPEVIMVESDSEHESDEPEDVDTTPPAHEAVEENSSSRRARRGPRKSYANMDLAESEDELTAASYKKAKKRKSEIDDEFMAVEVDDEPVSESDDEEQLARDLGENSSDEEFDEEEDVEVAPRRKSVKVSKVKKDDGDAQTEPKSKGTRARMRNLKSGGAEAKKINRALPPLFEIEDIFHDLTSKARTLGLDKVVKGLDEQQIRVATMCSGTESPLLALEMIADCLSKSDLGSNLEIEHLFSAEIVPFKQAYIERNFHPPVIFRDITELTSVVHDDEPMATTAYGGKALVPREVDMVIAGTSCVDFSGLNTHQKTMDDGGESADTWKAVLSYCGAFRPAIVLLENVSGADWDRMLGDYEAINYECSGVSVNTRDYYLPQVRERGYMACFNKDSPKYAPGIANKWADLMEDFKRPASSPVSDFLMPNDQIVQTLIRNDEPTREVDWTQCQITQMEYRQDKRLGWARPITQWSESGSKLPPDNGQAAWYVKQVDRVLDTIDGAVLRKALDMYDCMFKTRIFDLSQNIHRETDHRPFGIAGCITPSGMYFVTDHGRVLTSEEALKLQGIPLSKISFTTETQSEIRSLAGNAMSSTVIAASILAALIPGYSLIDTQRRVPRQTATSTPRADPTLVIRSTDHVRATCNKSFDLNTVLHKADLATRRCYCEGSYGLATKPIQQCSDCGHTTCTSCGGNPAHEYRHDNAMSQKRISPAAFQDFVRSAMPLRVDFSTLKLTVAWPSRKYGEAVTAALRGSFAFSSIRRTHCWTVVYTSGSAVLELVLSPASAILPAQAQWRLYAAPSKDLPADSPLRRLLEQPVARSGDDSKTDRWSLRIPNTKAEALPLKITGSGPKVASWWSRMEMPDFANHTVSAFLDIKVESTSSIATVVAGKYRYLPRCGKACSSMYRKVGSGIPMFLFLDPTRTGEPKHDCFVFSRNIHLLEKDEVRPVVARISSSWRPWATNAKLQNADKSPAVQLLIDESWQDMSNWSLIASDLELDIKRCPEPAKLVKTTRCSQLAVLLSCSVPSSVADLGDGKKHIIFADDSKFFQKHAWAFEAMRRHLPSNDWHVLHVNAANRCETCAPCRPALRWGLSIDGKELKPYEDPHGAALYERAMKSRPEPIAVVVSPEHETFALALGLDVNTLAHRARSRLQQDGNVTYTWRFNTDAQPEYKFKPFKLRDTRGVSPYAKDLRMKIKLFPQQLMSLAWMREQEMGVNFDVEEGEEASIDALGWRAELRAVTTKTVRGGICADHPGFGKTITSLALIHSQFNESVHAAAEIQAELKPRANGFLPHAGTLIVCPASLIEQWVDEIHKKIEYGNQKMCVLRTVADFTKHTISGFQNFRIVVVNRSLLYNDTYVERLAAFAGIPGPVSNKGRPFTHWLKFAHKQIPNHLQIRSTKGPKEFKNYIETLYRKHVKSDDFKAAVPSKRLTGADYIAGKEKKVTSDTKVRAQSSVDTLHLDKPLLSMYYWNRVIVDEFHQLEAKVPNVVVSEMQADKRWGLSATPAISDFYEIARMGELIGVPLRMGSDGAGIMRNASVRELRKDMTHFELFDAMRQPFSDSLHSRIHEIDQQFLDTFVRQNIMDNNQMRIQEHLLPVILDLDHRAMYAEVSQHLNSADMRIKKKNSRATDRDKRFNAAVSTSTTAEEALHKVAAYAHREEDGIATNSSKNDVLSLESVVATRNAAVDVILHKLPAAMSEAKGTEKAFGKWIKSRLEDGTLGDTETCEQLSKIAKAAKGVKITAAEIKGRKDRGEDYGAGKRALTAFLNGLCNRLLVEKRSARYMQSLYDLQQAAAQTGQKTIDEVECDAGNACSKQNSFDVAISALCGHMICRACYKRQRRSENMQCPDPGCRSTMQDHHLFWPSKLGDLSKCIATPYGAKIYAAMEVLEMIREKKEQAVLFVQFPNQLDEIEMALEQQGISATVVKSVEKAGVQLKSFSDNAGTKQQKTVIVLNSSDETAAGSNLQNANHVIFLSPLLKETQYGYDSTMAQTIGRVRRHGQKKEIHIYRIVALETVDVDILKQREKRSDALVEQGAPKIARPSALAAKTGVLERTQLYRQDGHFSLRPQSWVDHEKPRAGAQNVKNNSRMWWDDDFSSIIKFSKNFTEDDE